MAQYYCTVKIFSEIEMARERVILYWYCSYCKREEIG
jgi:hypothetical protein